jgi:uncharacterized membrane protein (UPF0127 family)
LAGARRTVSYCEQSTLGVYAERKILSVLPLHRVTVRVVHEADGTERTLATDVEVADGIVSQGLGLMFRRSVPDDYALVFPFSGVSKRSLHMVFVPFDIDALWLVDGRVRAKKRLSAWTGYGRAEADTVVELPAGAVSAVSVGDAVRIEGL